MCLTQTVFAPIVKTESGSLRLFVCCLVLRQKSDIIRKKAVKAMKQSVKNIKTPIPRIAAVHDLSGYGRSSLTVVMPILSSMGMQICPLPTAVLSSQTAGMEDFSFFDLTEQMREIVQKWKNLSLHFDAVYSGFLGSPEQVDIVDRLVFSLAKKDSIFLVDPVLGDEGELYPTQTNEIAQSMRFLAGRADIITPNFTEACLLLDTPYEKHVNPKRAKEFLRALANLDESKKNKKKTVLITSAPCEEENYIRVIAYEAENGRYWQTKSPRINASYPGTGDAFASVFLGALLQKDSIPMAMARAARFVYEAMMATYGYNTPYIEGVMLEKVLPQLRSHDTWLFEDF